MQKNMGIPVIDLKSLRGEGRSKAAMAALHNACENWGFFMVENHDIDGDLMEKMKSIINEHYEEYMKENFYKSDVAKCIDHDEKGGNNVDWESSFFISHHPCSNITSFAALSEDLRKSIAEYIGQLMKVAENLSELMSENLGLEKSHIRNAFHGSKGPSVGTKLAKYPECPHAELVRGLREHTDAGGIILLLHDGQVSGLEFLRGGEWVKVPPSTDNLLFVNTGDQIEVLSNGWYKSSLHRVMASKQGSRLSIATFYNPAGDAIISPAPELLYPKHFRFQDYLKLYSTTKFSDKGPRFQSMKEIITASHEAFIA